MLNEYELEIEKVKSLNKISESLRLACWILLAQAIIGFGALMKYFGNLHPFWENWQS